MFWHNGENDTFNRYERHTTQVRERVWKTSRQALFSTRAEIEQLSYALLKPLFPVTKGIRLLGLTLSSLGESVG